MNLNNGPLVDDATIASLRAKVRELETRRVELESELRTVTPLIRKYERAIALLSNTTPDIPRGRPKSAVPKRPVPSRVGPEKMAEIWLAIESFTQDHEEFRQHDIRAITGMTSSVMATAFEQLRQDNKIRFARQDGLSKYYRLTREQVGVANGLPEVSATALEEGSS